MEADFLREYRIDLIKEIEHMSWRRFCVLLRNLSAESAVAIRTEMEEKRAKNEDPDPEDDRRAADLFFSAGR